MEEGDSGLSMSGLTVAASRLNLMILVRRVRRLPRTKLSTRKSRM